jgi:PAS domain S-box-containing protein
LTYIRKDGSRFPAVVSVTALRDGQGGIIGYLLIGTDNTARKQVEAEQEKLDQRLRDQQFYTRSLIESNVDALVTTDPRGIITDVNKQMEALTDCTRDELIGAPFKSYFTDPQRAEVGIKLMLSGKKVTDYELTACARDGKKTVVSYNATTFYDRDRKLQGVFAAARDVTERKRFERALQETNVELESARFTAEKANLAKSDFLSSMSHELRTPLNAIIGFSEILADKTFGELNVRQLKYSNNILNSGRHLLQLINDILDLAKVEAGPVELMRNTFSVGKALSEVQTIVKTLANKKHISLNVEVDSDLPSLLAHEAKFKQVMFNLLSNAIKFTPDGGKVFVTAAFQKATSVGSSAAEDCLRVAVTDTGIGIKVTDQERVFKAFEQVDSSYGRQQQGTGLGLALTKKLVEMHGGRIWVESEGAEGKGSTFTFLIPISKVEAKPTQPTDKPDSRDDTVRPLVEEAVATGANL